MPSDPTYLVTKSQLTDIASAIRTKNGESTLYTVDEMPNKVLALPGGSGGITISAFSTTSNGVFTAPTGYAYSPVTVNVPTSPSHTATITNTGSSSICIFYNGTDYHTAGDTFDYRVGDTATLYIKVSSGSHSCGQIYVDGTSIHKGMLDTNVEYNYTLPNKDITISLSWPVINITTITPTISITENGMYDVQNYYSANVSVVGEGDYLDIRAGLSNYYNSTVSVVPSFAFYYMSNLTYVDMPNCKTINEYAFNNCIGLSTISFPACTYISSCAFRYCSSLQSTYFPSVTNVGQSAFYYCSSLETADFPNALTLDYYAFYCCSSLSSINFPKVENMYSYAFARCSTLVEAVFSLAKFMGGNAFEMCSSLTTAYFPSCSYISPSTFRLCVNLTTAYFPSCKYVGSSAFYSCTNLSSVNLDMCNTIFNYAFYSCSNLPLISLPKCTTINSYAFAWCSNLLSLYLLGSSVPTLTQANAFNGTPIGSSIGGVYGSIYVRESLYDTFITATRWSQFSSRFVSLTDAEIEALG